MRTFNFSVLAVLGCIAVVGAAPIGKRAPAEAIGGLTADYQDQNLNPKDNNPQSFGQKYPEHLIS
jgi:hypothetical protein